MADADAARNQNFTDGKIVIAELERRCGTEQIETVVHRPGKRKRLAETAGTTGELSRSGVDVEAAVEGHLLKTDDGIERADQDAAGESRLLAGDVHAVVAAVDEVDV